MENELAAGRAGVGRHNRDLDAELVGRAGLALADAFRFGSVEGIELPAALALLLSADLAGARQRGCECGLKLCLACDLAADVADQPAEPGAQPAQLAMVAVELLGLAPGHHRGVLGDAPGRTDAGARHASWPGD
jgi:hypothetical protein